VGLTFSGSLRSFKEENLMNGPDVLGVARQQLFQAVRDCEPSAFAPLNVSPWVAMSALQKAIRRGRNDIAQSAAAALLQSSPDRFWRRCGIIAFEDIGVADLDAVFAVTAALAGKRFRRQLGGEWRVASAIVSRMARAPKCRAADDLLLVAENLPAYDRARLDLAALPTADLLRIATGSGPLAERALALWYAIGTDRRPSRHLQTRHGEPRAVFDALCEAGLPHTVVEIAREGFRRVGEVLCPFVALLCQATQNDVASVLDDDFPTETMIGAVPSWAFDMYSREGQLALRVFLQGRAETARWVRVHIPPRQRASFLGGVVFRVEGGLVRSRLCWPTATELRRQVDVECHGSHCPDATEILRLMRGDMALLNEVRGHVC
jgi:hypothetical protein